MGTVGRTGSIKMAKRCLALPQFARRIGPSALEFVCPFVRSRALGYGYVSPDARSQGHIQRGEISMSCSGQRLLSAFSGPSFIVSRLAFFTEGIFLFGGHCELGAGAAHTYVMKSMQPILPWNVVLCRRSPSRQRRRRSSQNTRAISSVYHALDPCSRFWTAIDRNNEEGDAKGSEGAGTKRGKYLPPLLD
ncbi:hypothetical protein MPTK1_4g06080 [Marchantia polymorpha subsp. ruderalis]|uniref:Uncharacterized protein n=2 Tax=Marchantia polymorpha TaxID=3197 RepID=A0AAF6B6V5_MARPO|nr:hypothetical protein MARPO_0114s0046 [Marchantia polymorpha]BBN07739.1 hypothetical protein Mp_4g06080 [Marchantia polymorpha subsp. ruderalis]|eukprot:PTQ31234.1 hypothetical protein MARPO_0114s0046 [Marchantia polymorpha]